ncbi:hypothetical protein [Rhizobium etli]|uniref:hypothetical protein n=1 Tax=Rhizobium etli TaxID=29449 RepID=UPI0012DB34DE|nr:hypothetical protein [Rhizobium etli]
METDFNDSDAERVVHDIALRAQEQALGQLSKLKPPQEHLPAGKKRRQHRYICRRRITNTAAFIRRITKDAIWAKEAKVVKLIRSPACPPQFDYLTDMYNNGLRTPGFDFIRLLMSLPENISVDDGVRAYREEGLPEVDCV